MDLNGMSKAARSAAMRGDTEGWGRSATTPKGFVSAAVDPRLELLQLICNGRAVYPCCKRGFSRCLHYHLQVFGDHEQATNHYPMSSHNRHTAFGSAPKPALGLKGCKHVGSPHQPGRYLMFQVVKAIGEACCDGKFTSIEAGKDLVAVGLSSEKERVAFAASQTLDLSCNDFVGRRNLSGNLHKHKNPFGCISFKLPLFFTLREFERDARCGIRGFSKAIGENTKDYRCQHRKEAEKRRPSIPPNHTVLAQPQALANPLCPTHSLIPLWIRRHFAMGLGRAAA